MQVLYYVNRRPKIPKREIALPIIVALPPPQQFGGAATKFLYYVNRRVRVELRPKALVIIETTPPPPSEGLCVASFLGGTGCFGIGGFLPPS